MVSIFVFGALQSVFATQYIFLQNPFKNDNNYQTQYSGYYDNRYSAEDFYFPQNTTASRNYSNAQSIYDGLIYSEPKYHNSSQWYQSQISYLPIVSAQSRYPGCSRDDILIGGQIWASCNSLDRKIGSDVRSGWFFAGDMYAMYQSENGFRNYLQPQDKNFAFRAWLH